MKQAKRIERELTSEERARLRRSRDQVESEKQSILAKGRRYKAECDAKKTLGHG
jgi:hypothetical protein